MSKICVDKAVGEILAGWRYDISGLAVEMREDYEQHFIECARCRSKQKLHRTIDFSLITIASASALVFLLAFGAIRHFNPARALLLEIAALSGFAFSALMWIIVAVSTPVPVVVAGVARHHARKLHDRLPEDIKNKIPENLSSKISE
jgi:hypothetical protein